jgi:hypothetical protein
MSKSRPSAASSSLPVLTFSKFGPTNYISWSEEIVTHCIREYGLLASCLQTAEYPEIAEVEEPTAQEIADDESGLIKFRYQEQVRARNKKQFSMDEKKPLMYGTIFAQLSKESRDRVRRDASWDETEASQDPLRLWVIIGATHQGAGVGVPLVDQLVAQKNYQTLKQSRQESCFNFKQRFEQAVDMLENTADVLLNGNGAPLPTERMPDRIQARDYVDKLDDSRFRGLKLQLHNNLLMGLNATFPTTLLDAYDLAENYKVPTRHHASSGGDSHTQTVFAAMLHENRHASESKPKAGKKGDTRSSERGTKEGGKSQKGTSKFQKKEKPAGPKAPKSGGCFICGGPHFAKDCPEHEEAQEDAGLKKGPKVKTVVTAKAQESDDEMDEIVLSCRE